MYIPVAGGSLGTAYGVSGRLWSSGHHTGVDITARKGAAIFSAFSGVVISVGWGGAYGNLVKVRQDDGTIAYYAHMSAFSVKVGQRVARGSVLGKVGATGNTTGPHLHFEVRSNGKSINPMSYLSGDGGGKNLPANSGGGGGGMAGEDLTPDELAQLAGFTVAFFNSIPELKKLFAQAQKGDWTGDRLLAAVRNTQWYKTRTAKQREMEVLRTSDPAEYKSRLQGYTSIRDQAIAQVGLRLSDRSQQLLLNQIIMNGWGIDEAARWIGKAFDLTRYIGTEQVSGGAITDLVNKFRAMNEAYGVSVSDKTLGQNIDSIISGTMTPEGYEEYVKNLAKQTYVGLADQIDMGMTVRQAADPYIQTQAQLLEIDPNGIKLSDPTLRQALSYRDKEGKIGTKTIWQFEQDLRSDPRWMKTDNARESLLGVGRKVLSDLGMVF